MTVSTDALFEAIDATWPAARMIAVPPWTIREGRGGGKRVSAATLSGRVAGGDIAKAERVMRTLGQNPLFLLRPEDSALDAELAARGYAVVDPVAVLICPVAKLMDVPVPKVTAFTIWHPLAIMVDIWAAGGVGPARLDVMHRAACKTAVLARWNQKPAGTAFVAVHNAIAMVHAVEVVADQRRQGVAGWIMRQAAIWAQGQGAQIMAVLCTTANTPAMQLYSGLGFTPTAQYHYRYNPNDGDPRNG